MSIALSSQTLASDTISVDRRPSSHDPLGMLTLREREILAYIAGGMAPKEIGARLCRSPATIRNHHARILGKLNLNNDVELGLFLARHGLTRGFEADTVRIAARVVLQ